MANTQQMTIETVAGPLSASVVIPGSKSISNRVLLLAALAEGVSTLTNLQISDDTLVFVRALQALGFGVEETGDAVCTVTGAAGGAPNASASVWCGSAGTAARFLLASVAAGEGDYHFDATAQMKRRPCTRSSPHCRPRASASRRRRAPSPSTWRRADWPAAPR